MIGSRNPERSATRMRPNKIEMGESFMSTKKTVRQTAPTWLLVAVAALLLVGKITPAWSQAAAGTIEGYVYDPDGAVIPGAEVRLTNPDTGLTRTVTADERGRYSFLQLPVGSYELTVTQAGFAELKRTGIVLQVGDQLKVDATLELAGVRAEVVVTEAVPLVEPSKTESSTIIGARSIEDLPINGRRFTDFVLLTPGVTQDPRGLTSQTTGDLSFGGLRGQHNNIQVDGVDNNNVFFGQALGRFRAGFQVSQAAVKEFRVLNANYAAEYGRAGGAIVNVITKSGTNDWHGEGFYFIRDSGVSARHPFTTEKLKSRQQQFGASLGGPVVRDRLFFFVNTEQQVFRVPSSAQCSGLGGRTVDPCFTAAELTNARMNTAFPQLGGLTPIQYIRGQAHDFTNVLLNNASMIRADWRITDNHTFTGRYNYQFFHGANNVFFDFVNPVTRFSEEDNGTERVRTDSVVLSLTSVFGGTKINEFNFQWARDDEPRKANTSIPTTRIDAGPSSSRLLTVGRADILPAATNQDRLQFLDNFTWVRGGHTVKFGADLNFVDVFNLFRFTNRGSYRFRSPQEFANHLAINSSYREFNQILGTSESNPNSNEFGVFVQDSIRLFPNFTLYLGLRYELQTYDESELVDNPVFRAEAALAPLIPAGTTTANLPEDKNNWGPRIGFAWGLGEKQDTVLRAGYGVFYSRTPQIVTQRMITDNGIVTQSFRLTNIAQGEPTWPNTFCGPAPNEDFPNCPPPPVGVFLPRAGVLSSNFVQPFIQQWSFTLERELWRDYRFAATYLGVKGTHLLGVIDGNLNPPTFRTFPVFDSDGNQIATEVHPQFSATPSGSAVRPMPSFDRIQLGISDVNSSYNALILTAQKRFSHGVQFLVNYTWSKAIDTVQNQPTFGSPRIENPYNLGNQRGLSVTDQRHRFVANGIWAPRPPHMDNQTARYILDHWRFSSIITLGSGRPINPDAGNDPNRDANFDNDRIQLFGRNTFRGPGYANVDFRITRQIPVTERMRFEFVAEFFNLFNRTNGFLGRDDDGFFDTAFEFGTFASDCGGAANTPCFNQNDEFLTVTDAFNPRQIQFALKFLF